MPVKATKLCAPSNFRRFY